MTGLVHGFSLEGPRYRCIHLLGQYRRLQALSETSALRCTFLENRMTEGGVRSLSKFFNRQIKSLHYYQRDIHNDFKYNLDSYDHVTAKLCLLRALISFPCRIFIYCQFSSFLYIFIIPFSSYFNCFLQKIQPSNQAVDDPNNPTLRNPLIFLWILVYIG